MNKVEKLSTVPAAFSGIAAKVNEVIDANPPLKAGRFIKITTSNENVLISAEITAQSIAALAKNAFDHPFKVYLDNSATPSAKILAQSRFYATRGTSSTTITNLTTSFTLASNTYVWLQVNVSGLSVTSASRQTGTAWPSFVVTSGSPATQTQFNVPIGKVTASAPTAPGFEFNLSGTTYHFEQMLFTHLLAQLQVENNVAILQATAWSGA